MFLLRRSLFALSGRAAMILSAIASPIPGSLISSSRDALFRSTRAAAAGAALAVFPTAGFLAGVALVAGVAGVAAVAAVPWPAGVAGVAFLGGGAGVAEFVVAAAARLTASASVTMLVIQDSFFMGY